MFGISNFKIDVGITIGILVLLSLMIFNHWRSSRPRPSSPDAPSVDIKDLITSVKSALAQIEQENITKNEAALFEVKDFDLELNFIVRKDEKGSGRIETKVLTFGAEELYGSENVQKIKLHLTAIAGKERGQPSTKDIPAGEEAVVGEVPPEKPQPKRK